MAYHEPVMVDEVLKYLEPRSGTVIDATVGGGGHARAILAAQAEAGSRLRLLGLDRDSEAIASAQRLLSSFDNAELIQADYSNMTAIVERLALRPVTGVIMDLGVSLHQLETPHRGFGFGVSGPLDMRFDQSDACPTAADLLRRTPMNELRDLLRRYGQEPMSGRVARVIVERRARIRTTRDLADSVRAAVPSRFAGKALARVFQALRIAVNNELESVRLGLRAALSLLAVRGRLVVLSYHSLEDRIAKECLRGAREAGFLRILTPKPERPGAEEVARNPRARSARLRAAEKVADGGWDVAAGIWIV